MADKPGKIYRVHLDVVDSTNRYARNEAYMLKASAGDAVIIAVTADNQTEGRGQRGNKWLSSSGENVLLTILVEPCFLAPVHQFALSQAIALAVRDAMLQYGIAVQLKWPNDIYVGKGKLAGILIELDCGADNIARAIIGVGLNVNQTLFAPMERVPTSMKMLECRDFDVNDVTNSILLSFTKRYSLIEECDSSLADEYKQSLVGWGVPMLYKDASGMFYAVIEDVEPDGHLLLRSGDGGLRRYAFKEVELCL